MCNAIKKNLKNYACISIGLAIVTWIILIYHYEGSLTITKNSLFRIPTVVTINGIFWAIFIRWGWKFKYFRNWLVPFPNLSGTWYGKVIPNNLNPETKQIYNPVDISVEIRQTFLNIYVKVYSHEMESKSYSASFIINHEENEKKLCYSYLSKPRSNIRGRSPIHDGTALLIIEGKKEDELKGEYWTNRKSTGEIYITKNYGEKYGI